MEFISFSDAVAGMSPMAKRFGGVPTEPVDPNLAGGGARLYQGGFGSLVGTISAGLGTELDVAHWPRYAPPS